MPLTPEQYLKQVLPPKPYYFEQTGIAEIAPRPTPATLSLLGMIYAADGPVQRVYAKFGVTYIPQDVFRLLGNQLFVDREKELKTLLPAYSYFVASPWSPKLSTTKGAWTTFKNVLALQRISPRRDDGLVGRLDAEFKLMAEDRDDLKRTLEEFLRAYALVFEINLKAEKAIQKLDLALGSTFKPTDILASPATFGFYTQPHVKFPQGRYQGNSLELNDMSDFIQQTTGGNIHVTDDWWQKLSEDQKRLLERPIGDALFFSHLREVGRWLAVGHVNRLRSQILAKAASCGFRQPENALFATLEEIQDSPPSEAVCEERKLEYGKSNVWDFPSVIRSDQTVEPKPKGLGLAPGQAAGVLVMSDGVRQTQGDVILFTKLLTPDLAVHLGRIKGIVSERGSALSHLAILAREKGMPVVANVHLEAKGIKIGDKVAIDGSAGTVTML